MDSELSRVAIAGRHVAARRETARARAFAVLRIAFGIVVAIDAAYKWVPAFRTETLASQFAQHLVTIDTPVEHQWIALWSWLAIHYQNPFGFAVAVIETAIAVGLLTGGFTRLVCVAGALFGPGSGLPRKGWGCRSRPGRPISAPASSMCSSSQLFSSARRAPLGASTSGFAGAHDSFDACATEVASFGSLVGEAPREAPSRSRSPDRGSQLGDRHEDPVAAGLTVP